MANFTSRPPQPMSVINIVTASLRLYRDSFSTYFSIGVIASLWASIPILAILPIPFLIFFQVAQPSIILAVSPIWLILLIFTSAKSITNLALISRLAFGFLINKPEAVTEAKSYVMPKMWKFWRASLWAGLLILAVSFGLGLITGIAGGFFSVIIQMVFGSFAGGQSSPLGYLIFGLFALIIFASVLIFFIRFAIGFSLIEVILAMENNLNAWEGVQKSQQLIKGYAGKVFNIFFVVVLLLIPLQIVVSWFADMIIKAVGNILSMNPESQIFIAISFLIGLLIGTGFGVVVYPFYQIIKSLIYYDLRARKEGID